MAIVGEKCGLFPVLKEWVQSKRPVKYSSRVKNNKKW